MKKLKKYYFLGFCIIGFILVRSLHFSELLNFSTDQGEHSLRAMQLWRDKEITFTGPTASFNYQGHYLRQSSVIFYTTLAFLLPFNFNPIPASYTFMILASWMCAPLYLGMKKLSNQKAAELVTGLYAFLPFFINYTSFLWNPNYQLALAPLLVYFLGTYRETKKDLWLFISGVMAGILFLFHYQFVLIILGLLGIALYYVWNKKLTLKQFLLGLGGIVVGLLPLILFEIRSQFYLSNTILLLLKHGSETTTGFAPHYLLVVLFTALCVAIGSLFKAKPKFVPLRLVRISILLLFSYSILSRLPAPQGAFGMPRHWNYLLEAQANQIIQNEQLENYAVVNNLYETKATVQYFLLERDQAAGWTAGYEQNQYLFIITSTGKGNFQSEIAYELNTFTPSIEIKRWQLSPYFDLVLLERVDVDEILM